MTRLEQWLGYQIWGRRSDLRRVPRRRRFRRGPVRDARYKAWIRTLPCLHCGCYGSEAAHTGEDGGMRQKASDRSCVPLCPESHTLGPRAYHQIGRDRFEEENGICFRDVVRDLNARWEERLAGYAA